VLYGTPAFVQHKPLLDPGGRFASETETVRLFQN
jgi:hypothetical protein